MIDIKNNRIKMLTVLLTSYILLIAFLCILAITGASGGIAVAAVYALTAIFAVHFLKGSCVEYEDIEYSEEFGEKASGRCRGAYTDDRCEPGFLICIKNYISGNRLRNLLLSAAVLIVLTGFSFLITFVFGSSNIPADKLSLDSNISFFALFGIAVSAFRHVLVPAICEEFYFRRIVFCTLKKGCGISFLLSAAVSSLLFIGLHMSGVDSVIFAFVSGSLLSFLIYVTDSVAYCCAVHFIYNLIAFVIAVA